MRLPKCLLCVRLSTNAMDSVRSWTGTQVPVVRFRNGAEIPVLPSIFSASVPNTGECRRVQVRMSERRTNKGGMGRKRRGCVWEGGLALCDHGDLPALECWMANGGGMTFQATKCLPMCHRQDMMFHHKVSPPIAVRAVLKC